MKLNRKIPPKITLSEDVDFLQAETEQLSNGMLLHKIERSYPEVMRLQLVFPAGRVHQSKALVAEAANQLLVEGTKNRTESEIAELIENKGAFIDCELDADTAWITLYCLNGKQHLKKVEELLLLLKEIAFEADFPEKQFLQYKRLKQQEFSVDAQKVAFLAKNNFSPFLLGENHPYVNHLQMKDFAALQREDVLNFYRDNYLHAIPELFLAGHISSELLALIDQLFGQIHLQKSSKEKNQKAVFTKNAVKESSREKCIPLENAMQSAIRMGKLCVGKQHPDFIPLFVANAILGGYFGSRLMSNIREDKGYTYGIGSALIVHREMAYFVLATEVGAELSQKTLQEIGVELRKMSEELVEENELRLVKNYLRGNLLRSFDGAFAAMDRFRSLRKLNLDEGFYTDLFQGIKAVNAEQIRQISQKYLAENEMKVVVVGKKM